LSRTTDSLRALASAVSTVADLTTSLAYLTISAGAAGLHRPRAGRPAASLACVPDPADPPPEDLPGRHPPDTPTAGIRPAPDPIDVDVARLVLLGMGVWAVAFFVLLPFRSRLDAAGHGYWLWTCVAGFGLGILGYVLAARARRRS
jgi:hypothetical protein